MIWSVGNVCKPAAALFAAVEVRVAAHVDGGIGRHGRPSRSSRETVSAEVFAKGWAGAPRTPAATPTASPATSARGEQDHTNRLGPEASFNGHPGKCEGREKERDSALYSTRVRDVRSPAVSKLLCTFAL